MQNPIKILCLSLLGLGLLAFGGVPVHAAGVHQINLKHMIAGSGANQRNYPEFANPQQNVLKAKHKDRMRFHFPGRPHDTTITIQSRVKIDRDSTGTPPYSYDGKAGFSVNPEEGVYQIKYDVIVEKAGDKFEVLDPMIIVDD